MRTATLTGVIASLASAQETLRNYNVDRHSISVSGFSSGGFMAAQLGIAYSEVFKAGFGVFAGGPFDCARDQNFLSCMFNSTPSISQPVANMRAWNENKIDALSNLKDRKIFLQAGALDDTIGLSITKLLQKQLLPFVQPLNVLFVTSPGAAHTFPTDFFTANSSLCNETATPYISNCQYDGAGEMLKWLYREILADRNTGTLTGSIIPYAQKGELGAGGFADTGFMYVPEVCERRSTTVCKLHVVLHGCTQNYEQIGDRFMMNTGYNMWADTNAIILLYPQTTVDNATYDTWSGKLANPMACFDWIGQYGESDQKGGMQMEAIVNIVKKIAGLRLSPPDDEWFHDDL